MLSILRRIMIAGLKGLRRIMIAGLKGAVIAAAAMAGKICAEKIEVAMA